MAYRLLTDAEKSTIRQMMTSAGFIEIEQDVDEMLNTGLHFYAPLFDDDRFSIIKQNLPHHFSPFSSRTVAIFSNYTTSDVRGTFRRYRSRHVYQGINRGNIFAHSGNGNDDPIENTKLWLAKYAKLEYNVS